VTADEIKTLQQRAQERAEATLKSRGLEYIYDPKSDGRDNYIRLMTYRAMEASMTIEYMTQLRAVHSHDIKKPVNKPIKRWGAYNDD